MNAANPYQPPSRGWKSRREVVPIDRVEVAIEEAEAKRTAFMRAPRRAVLAYFAVLAILIIV